jgi:pimeloyl-ACP methyl ester carboxylesterase
VGVGLRWRRSTYKAGERRAGSGVAVPADRARGRPVCARALTRAHRSQVKRPGAASAQSTAKSSGGGAVRIVLLGAGAVAAIAYMFRPVRPRAEAHTTSRGNTLYTENARDFLSEAEYKGISATFGGAQPPGRFLRGRHGATHYYLQSSISRNAPLKSMKEAGSPQKGLVLFAHGLGTNMHLYDEMVGPLLDDGFTVLRYDYLGHGWSAPDDKYFVYNKTVMLEQLEDLLDHVLGPGGTVYGFVGHSTGGCNGVLAASSLKDYKFERLVFVSPCFWKKAPLVSNLAGKMPGIVTAALRSGKLDFIPENDYKTAGVIAWMREGGKGNYVFPDAVQKKKDFDDLMFKHHPFVAAAIASLDLYILNNVMNFYRFKCIPNLEYKNNVSMNELYILQALMTSYREMMRELVGKGTKVRVLWGDGDQTVPYRCVLGHAKSVRPLVSSR